MYSDDLGAVARAALTEGAAGLSRFSLRLLSPIAPMLASPADDVDEALERLGEAAFEYKLDGARVQVHRAGDEVRVFTRQLQDVTARVPEVVEWARGLPCASSSLEGEAIALRSDGRPQPFQVTMRRLGRSKDVEAARRELPLSSFFFDCLFLEGEGPLVSLPYGERMERLRLAVAPELLLPRIVTGDADEADRFLRQALDLGHEGLMAKSLQAPYVAGQRGFHWLKLKSAHTLDLVVLAVEWGSGRRKGWLSNLHLGARDPESGGFVMLGKTFKGLTDEMLRWQTERLPGLEESARVGRPCPARAGGGDRVQRRPGIAALPRRARPALRARQALPEDKPAAGRHHRDGAPRSSAANENDGLVRPWSPVPSAALALFLEGHRPGGTAVALHLDLAVEERALGDGDDTSPHVGAHAGGRSDLDLLGHQGPARHFAFDHDAGGRDVARHAGGLAHVVEAGHAGGAFQGAREVDGHRRRSVLDPGARADQRRGNPGSIRDPPRPGVGGAGGKRERKAAAAALLGEARAFGT